MLLELGTTAFRTFLDRWTFLSLQKYDGFAMQFPLFRTLTREKSLPQIMTVEESIWLLGERVSNADWKSAIHVGNASFSEQLPLLCWYATSANTGRIDVGSLCSYEDEFVDKLSIAKCGVHWDLSHWQHYQHAIAL